MRSLVRARRADRRWIGRRPDLTDPSQRPGVAKCLSQCPNSWQGAADCVALRDMRTGAIPIALLVVLAACGGGSDSEPPGPPPPTIPAAGLDARPANASCRAGDAPSTSVTLAVERVFPNLPAFSVPILMLQEPASGARWYVVQKTGVIYAFDNQAAVSTRRVFIDVSGLIAVNPASSGDERGLLGMAFHPDYPANPRVYLSYTANAGTLVSRVVEFQTRDGGQTLDL